MPGVSPFPVVLTKAGEDDVVADTIFEFWAYKRDGYLVAPSQPGIGGVSAADVQAMIDAEFGSFPTPAQLRDRATHTGTQPSTSIIDFTEAVQDAVAIFFQQGANVTLTHNDAANTLTIEAAGGGAGGTDPEAVRDAIGIAMVGLGNISVVPNDAADTITITTTATVNATDAALRDRGTHTGVQSLDTITETTTKKILTDAERTKIAGIAAGATANATDAQLRDRSTHTGTQTSSTISDLAETIRDTIGATLVQGSGVTITVNDAADTITIASSGGGGLTAEDVRDTIGASLVEGAGIDIVINDAGDTITISATGGGTGTLDQHLSGSEESSFTPGSVAKVAVGGSNLWTGGLINTENLDPSASTYLRSRANHTGTQPSTSISDFTEAVQDAVAALLTSGTQVSLTYNDAGNTLTVSATGADAETMRDTIGAALVGVGNINVAVNDAGDTITITTTATANSTDAQLRDRSTHTGTQTVSTLSDFTTGVQGLIAATPDRSANSVALIGASVTANASSGGAGRYETPSGTLMAYYGRGAFGWANVALGQRLELWRNVAVGGEASDAILANQIPLITAMNPKPRFAIIGEWFANNIINNTARNNYANIVADGEAMVNALTAAGITVVLQGGHPISVLDTAPERLMVAQIDDWARNKAATTRGVIYWDVQTYLTDPTAAALNYRAGLSLDGAHYTAAGGQLAGWSLADCLRPHLVGSPSSSPSNADGRNMNTNPHMTGTTGTKGTGVTGTVATGWDVSFNGTAGTAVCEKVASDDFQGDWQQVRHTTGGATARELRLGWATPVTGITVGEKFCVEFEVESDDDWSFIDHLSCSMVIDAAVDGVAHDLLIQDSGSQPLQPVNGLLRTPVLTATATPVSVTGYLTSRGTYGTIRARRGRIRKVV